MFELTTENIENIRTVDDFVAFLKAMENDFKTSKCEWKNISLDDYFESVSAWIFDTQLCEDKLDYSALAKMLYMGKIYE